MACSSAHKPNTLNPLPSTLNPGRGSSRIVQKKSGLGLTCRGLARLACSSGVQNSYRSRTRGKPTFCHQAGAPTPHHTTPTSHHTTPRPHHTPITFQGLSCIMGNRSVTGIPCKCSIAIVLTTQWGRAKQGAESPIKRKPETKRRPQCEAHTTIVECNTAQCKAEERVAPPAYPQDLGLLLRLPLPEEANELDSHIPAHRATVTVHRTQYTILNTQHTVHYTTAL